MTAIGKHFYQKVNYSNPGWALVLFLKAMFTCMNTATPTHSSAGLYEIILLVEIHALCSLKFQDFCCIEAIQSWCFFFECRHSFCLHWAPTPSEAKRLSFHYKNIKDGLLSYYWGSLWRLQIKLLEPVKVTLQKLFTVSLSRVCLLSCSCSIQQVLLAWIRANIDKTLNLKRNQEVEVFFRLTCMSEHGHKDEVCWGNNRCL